MFTIDPLFMTFSFFCTKNDLLWLKITYAGLIGLLIFMPFALPTVPEMLSNWLDKPFDFHVLILVLLLPYSSSKYFSFT